MFEFNYLCRWVVGAMGSSTMPWTTTVSILVIIAVWVRLWARLPFAMIITVAAIRIFFPPAPFVATFTSRIFRHGNVRTVPYVCFSLIKYRSKLYFRHFVHTYKEQRISLAGVAINELFFFLTHFFFSFFPSCDLPLRFLTTFLFLIQLRYIPVQAKTLLSRQYVPKVYRGR